MAFFRKIFAFIKKDFLIWKGYKLSFILEWLGILTSIFTLYFITKLFGKGASPYLIEYGGQYFPFALLGIAFSSYLTVALGSLSGKIREEQMMGTLEAMLVSPTRISTIIISMSMWDFILSSINMFIYLLFGIWLFGVNLNYSNLFTVFVILLLTVISFSSIGIIAASFIMVFKRGNPVIWLITTFSVLFGEVFFPASVLPKKLQVISHLLPITYSLRGLRLSLLQGYSLKVLLPEITVLLIFSVLLLPLGIFLFKFAVNKAKMDGSLTHY